MMIILMVDPLWKTINIIILGVIENDKFDRHYTKYSVIECQDDMDLTIEESLQFKELIQDQIRTIKIIPYEKKDLAEEATDVREDQNVDGMVIDHLSKLDTEGSDYDSILLIDLYENCETT